MDLQKLKTDSEFPSQSIHQRPQRDVLAQNLLRFLWPGGDKRKCIGLAYNWSRAAKSLPIAVPDKLNVNAWLHFLRAGEFVDRPPPLPPDKSFSAAVTQRAAASSRPPAPEPEAVVDDDDNENRVAVAQPSEKSPVVLVEEEERSLASLMMAEVMDQDAAADECGPSKRARIDPIAIMELQYLDDYGTNDQDYQYKRILPDQCGDKFNRLDNLKTHIKGVHKETIVVAFTIKEEVEEVEEEEEEEND